MAFLHLWQTVPAKIKLLYPDAQVPKYMSDGSAGADVCAYLDRKLIDEQISKYERDTEGAYDSFRVHRFETLVIPLGFAMEIPVGFVGVVKGRSGNAKHGVEGHVAFIDSDYRGQVCMIVHGGPQGVRINHGERIGQIAILPCFRPMGGFQVVDELSSTLRGEGGFGSTGQ